MLWPTLHTPGAGVQINVCQGSAKEENTPRECLHCCRHLASFSPQGQLRNNLHACGHSVSQQTLTDGQAHARDHAKLWGYESGKGGWGACSPW